MRKDIFWNSVGTATWSFLSLFLLIIVTRVNGVTDSGLFSFAFAVAIIMFTVACYGGRAYQVSDHRGSFSSDDYVSLRLATSLTVLIITAFFVIANGYDQYKSALIFILVGYRVFDAISDVLYGIMQKGNRLYVSGKSLFYKSFISLVIFATLDLLTHNLLLASLSLPIVSLLFLFLYDLPHSRKLEKFSMKLNLTKIEDILKSTFLPFAIAVMGLVFANLARYFIDIYHPGLQGYFGILIMPLSLTILLFSFISTPILLHLSSTYNNSDFIKLRKYINKITSIMAGVTILLCIVAYFLSAPVLQLLFNLDFNRYTPDIILVLLIGAAISLTALFTNVAVIARRLRPVAAIYLVANILLVAFCYLLVGRYQIRGAITAYALTSLVQALAMAGYYRYLTNGQRLSRKS